VRGHVWLMCGQSCSDVRGNRNRQVYRDTCWGGEGHTRDTAPGATHTQLTEITA